MVQVPRCRLDTALAALQQHLGLAERMSIFLLLDETNEAREPGRLLKSLTGPLFSPPRERHFIFLVLLGTHQPDKTLAMDVSQTRLQAFDLLLLNSKEVDELLDRLAAISHQEPCPNKCFLLKGKYQITKAFQQLITDAGGWPRGLQAVLEQVSKRLADRVDWNARKRIHDGRCRETAEMQQI